MHSYLELPLLQQLLKPNGACLSRSPFKVCYTLKEAYRATVRFYQTIARSDLCTHSRLLNEYFRIVMILSGEWAPVQSDWSRGFKKVSSSSYCRLHEEHVAAASDGPVSIIHSTCANYSRSLFIILSSADIRMQMRYFSL